MLRDLLDRKAWCKHYPKFLLYFHLGPHEYHHRSRHYDKWSNTREKSWICADILFCPRVLSKWTMFALPTRRCRWHWDICSEIGWFDAPIHRYWWSKLGRLWPSFVTKFAGYFMARTSWFVVNHRERPNFTFAHPNHYWWKFSCFGNCSTRSRGCYSR